MEDSEGSRGNSGAELDPSIRRGEDRGRRPGSESVVEEGKGEREEGAGRVKLRKSDSFLRRLVKSSRDNIAEGCERLVRNIQKSPLPVLRRKLLSSDDGQRPIPPLRRKKSKRNLGDPPVSTTRPLPADHLLEPSIEGVPSNDLVEIRISGKRGEDSSRSVSTEDVEDLIRAEDNRRSLEQRAAIGRRRGERSSLGSCSGPRRARSRSEESLSSTVRGESGVASRRNASAGSGRVGSAERRRSKAKRSPPPDDWEAGDRGSRRDNVERWDDKDKAAARKWRIRGEVHARLATAAWLVKCKVANSAGNGGDEEGEDEDDEDEEETRGPERNGPRRGSEEESVAVGGDGRSLDKGDSSVVAASASRPPVRSRVLPCPSIPGRIGPATGDDDARVVVAGTDLVTIRVVRNEEGVRSKGCAGGGGGGVGCGGGGASSNEGRGNNNNRGRRAGGEEWKEERKMKLAVRMIRIRDKLMLGLSAFAILFTILLVMDLQMDLGYSGHHLVPSHGRVRVGDDPNTDTIYNNFRRKFLQRLNASREQTSGDTSATTQSSGGRGEGAGNEGGRRRTESRTEKTEVHDSFPDLADLVVKGYGVSVYEGVARISGEDPSDNPTLGELKKIGPK